MQWMLSTLLLTLSFGTYLTLNPQNDFMSVSGWLYYALACFSHAGLLCLAVFLVLFLIPALLRLPVKACVTLSSIGYTLLLAMGIINFFVYSLYRFHVNGIIISMLINGGSDIFAFDTSLWLKAFGGLCVIIFVNAAIALVALRIKFPSRFTTVSATAFVVALVAANLWHAIGFAKQHSAIVKSSQFIPYYMPLRANSLFKSLGIITADDYSFHTYDHTIESVNYPKHPLTYDTINNQQLPNLFFIIIDSWNSRSFTPECMPNTWRFSQDNEWFKNHFSSSNGTRGSIFGMFFSVNSIYWKDFDLADKHPAFIDALLHRDYQTQCYPSATLLEPPFAKNVFRRIPNLNTKTEGKDSYERDQNLSRNFINDLSKKDKNKPFFAFLFFDTPHAIALPDSLNHHFQPAWEYADYTRLNNQMDATPFWNLYRNCTYQVDSLIGTVLNAIEANGMMDNSIIIITGDHSQEFNENQLNYWGHNSNFTRWQLNVPLVIHHPASNAATYTHRTTHYDIAPTLMRDVLGVNNPTSDYSMGTSLYDTTSRNWHIVGSDIDYAFIYDDDNILNVRQGATLEYYDKHMRSNPHHPSAQQLNAAIQKMNQFYK